MSRSKDFVNSRPQQGINEVLKADKISHMSMFVQHFACWLSRWLISLQVVLFALFAVHRLCGLGACDSARGASEISRGLAQTVQLSVSSATSEKHHQKLLAVYNMCHSQVGHDDRTAHSAPHEGSRVPSPPLIYMTPSNSQWILSLSCPENILVQLQLELVSGY